MGDPFARLGAAMVRWRWLVVVAWLVLVVAAGVFLVPKASSVVKGGGYAVPGSDSLKAGEILDSRFNQSARNTVVVVYHSAAKTVDDAGYRDQVNAATDALKKVQGVRTITTFFNSGDPAFVSQDRHTTVASVAIDGDEGQTQDTVPKLRDALSGISIDHDITGTPAINYDLTLSSKEDLHRAEFFTIPLVLVLLVIIFRTLVAASVPLILGACGVALAEAAIYLLGSQTDISVYALNVASMIGLGLGIDFSLIVITRFREERARGRDTPDAVAMTMATAGRSITYSAVTVMLAMIVLTLLLLPLMIVRSISLGVLIVAVAALLTGLTLLPALLGILGHRIEWLRVIPRRKPRAEGQQGFWYRLSHAIMARPWVWLLISLAVLVAVASPVRNLQTVGADPGILPADKESVQGIRAMNQALGANRLTPIQVVVQTDKNGIWKPEFLDALNQLTNTAAADSRSDQVRSLTTLASTMGVPPDQVRSLTPEFFKADPRRAQAAAQVVNINGDNDTAVVTIISKYDQFSKEHENFIYDLRDKMILNIRQLRVYEVYVGGNAANFLDFRDALDHRFPILVPAVLLMTFLILMVFFQSILLPLKAILMNVASVLATYGALVLIFQNGWGSGLLGFDPVGKVSVVTPPVLFVILFGLSADYEVFMLSRVKEYYHQMKNNEEAVATGLEHTAGVITAAGLLLIVTFGSFASANIITIKEIGLGLAIGVLIDSTIVRVIMVPASMRLMGDANWWMPAWLKKIVPEFREGPAPELALQEAVAGVSTGSPPAPEDAKPVERKVVPSKPSAPRPPSTPMVGQLHPTSDSAGVDPVALPQTRPLYIGRHASNELRISDPRISRVHAQITYDGDGYAITDLDSTNGVYVNGQRIPRHSTRVTLHEGDVIEIGGRGAVTFAFHLRPLAQPPTVPRS